MPEHHQARERATVAEVTRWRALDAVDLLEKVADHVKEDATFKPIRALGTRRFHVVANGTDWELLVSGPKFFDPRTRRGGGGAADLVMYLWQVPFKAAVDMLRAWHI